MSFVTFKHRRTIPENFIQGTFYWIDKDDETSELWFGSRNGLIRLDNYFDRSEIEDIITRLTDVETDIENIQDVIENRINNRLTWKII